MFTPFDGCTVFPALMSGVLTAYNLVAWPSDRRAGRPRGKVSVLIPARNEEAVIGRAVRSALAACGPDDEVIVYEDQSTDRTAEVLGQFRDRRLRVVPGVSLPPGQVGKPHACARLGDVASGELLVFLDADVALHRDALGRFQALLDAYEADVLTGFPHQHATHPVVRAVLPMLATTYTSWIPLDTVWRRKEPWLLAVNGQVLVFRRAAYTTIGGYAAVAHEVVDDMAIGRRVKEAGLRLLFASVRRSAVCEMYPTPRAMWEGFSKNLYEGLGEKPWALVAAISLYLGAFVLPLVRAAVEWGVWGAVGWESAVGIVSAFLGAALLSIRLGQGVTPIVARPLAAIAVVAMALNSALWSKRGTVRWRGRTYARKALRGGDGG